MAKRRRLIAEASPADRNPFLSLPDDVLRLVVSGLNLRDHILLAATCRSLRKLTLVDNPPSSKPLYLVPSHNPRGLLLSFLSPPPPLYSLRPRRAADASLGCLGFFQGWLVVEEIIGDSTRLYLFNRILNSRIPLPKLKHSWTVMCAVLSADPRSDDCVVAIVIRSFSVHTCRPCRSRRWKKVSSSHYVFDAMFLRGELWGIAAHIKSNHRFLHFVNLSNGGHPMTLIQNIPSFTTSSFVHWDGKLMFAALSTGVNSSTFVVWELRGSSFVEVSDLHGRALIIGRTGMCGKGRLVSVDVHGNRYFDKDCIYLMISSQLVPNPIKGFKFSYCPSLGMFKCEMRNDQPYAVEAPSFSELFRWNEFQR